MSVKQNAGLAWGCVSLTVILILLDMILLPSFQHPMGMASHFGWGGAYLGLITLVVCTATALICPSGNYIAKGILMLTLVAGAFVGAECLSSWYYFGRNH